MVEIGTILFAASDTSESIEAAKAYIAEHGFTFDDVKIVRTQDSVLVKAKRGVKWEKKLT